MDTLLAAALLVVALLIVRAIAQIQRAESQRVRTYRADSVQRAAVRGGVEAEDDILYLWKLLCSRQNASRRSVVRSHELSAHRWNKANAVIRHLRLDPAKHSYREGVAIVQGFYARQAQLAQSDHFVGPIGPNEPPPL